MRSNILRGSTVLAACSLLAACDMFLPQQPCAGATCGAPHPSPSASTEVAAKMPPPLEPERWPEGWSAQPPKKLTALMTEIVGLEQRIRKLPPGSAAVPEIAGRLAESYATLVISRAEGSEHPAALIHAAATKGAGHYDYLIKNYKPDDIDRLLYARALLLEQASEPGAVEMYERILNDMPASKYVPHAHYGFGIALAAKDKAKARKQFMFCIAYGQTGNPLWKQAVKQAGLPSDYETPDMKEEREKKEAVEAEAIAAEKAAKEKAEKDAAADTAAQDKAGKVCKDIKACEAACAKNAGSYECTHLAHQANDDGDLGRALAFAKKGCAAGNKISCNGVKIVTAKAEKCSGIEDCTPACNAGFGGACTSVGQDYYNLKKDKLKATQHFKKACDLSDGLGCNEYGMSLSLGEGVPKDYKLAQTTFKKACGLLQTKLDATAPAALIPGMGVMAARDSACRNAEGMACVIKVQAPAKRRPAEDAFCKKYNKKAPIAWSTSTGESVDQDCENAMSNRGCWIVPAKKMYCCPTD